MSKHFKRQTSLALHNSGVPKRDVFRWGVIDGPGRYVSISKHQLEVYGGYQRNRSSRRAIEIAKKWSWVACGTISVAAIGDSRYAIIDGQHRWFAAMNRDDIDMLPCLVFELPEIKDQAKAFMDINLGRGAVSASDKFNAQLAAGDALAQRVDEMMRIAGRVAATNSSSSTVAFVRRLYETAAINFEMTEGVFFLCAEMCEGKRMNHRIFEALFYIEKNVTAGQTILKGRWREKLLSIGVDELMRACASAAAHFAAGGAKVWASGVLSALNKGSRHKLSVATITP